MLCPHGVRLWLHNSVSPEYIRASGLGASVGEVEVRFDFM